MENLAELHSGLLHFLRDAPLPFHRRTILEIMVNDEADIEWAAGTADLLAREGIQIRWLEPEDVLDLITWFFQPSLP